MQEKQTDISRYQLLGLRQIVKPDGLINIGKSTWWKGVQSGRFPKPILVGRRSLWRASDIFNLIDGFPRAP